MPSAEIHLNLIPEPARQKATIGLDGTKNIENIEAISSRQDYIQVDHIHVKNIDLETKLLVLLNFKSALNDLDIDLEVKDGRKSCCCSHHGCQR